MLQVFLCINNTDLLTQTLDIKIRALQGIHTLTGKLCTKPRPHHLGHMQLQTHNSEIRLQQSYQELIHRRQSQVSDFYIGTMETSAGTNRDTSIAQFTFYFNHSLNMKFSTVSLLTHINSKLSIKLFQFYKVLLCLLQF